MPTITSGSVSRRMIRNARLHRSPSNTTGANSRASTVRYSITHHATSNSGESVCQCRIGRQMFHGRPRSTASPSATAT